jgi:hypothetical protein
MKAGLKTNVVEKNQAVYIHSEMERGIQECVGEMRRKLNEAKGCNFQEKKCGTRFQSSVLE